MKYILTIVSNGDTPHKAICHAGSVLSMVSTRNHDLMGMAAGDATGTAIAEWSTPEGVADGDDKMCRQCGGFIGWRCDCKIQDCD